MAETTYDDMTDADLMAAVQAFEDRLAEARAHGARQAGQGTAAMTVAEIERELNLARAVLAARALHTGLP